MKFSQKRQRRRRFLNQKTLFLGLGFVLGVCVVASLYQTSVYFSSDESCAMCHVHPHATDSWKLSKHVNNGSGTRVHCVDCHLPPKHQTVAHYAAKLDLGLRDAWALLTKDSADFNWDQKSELEHAVKYIPNASCKECHPNLFPDKVSNEAITAHLYYEENEKKLDLQCISCHLDAGHYNPDYNHGATDLSKKSLNITDTALFFKAATPITSFSNFMEQISGSSVAFTMVAIPGGTFKMGSPDKEPFRKADEGPVRTVTVSPFFMSEVEVTWDMFLEFYTKTATEGRTPPENVFAVNSNNPDADGVSGPTPPFGAPDQGWGGGDRPAITMTHYAAETFCQWLSLKTGKKYRLPTEAEWEYAARGGTETPYFFPGSPKDFSNEGFWRKFFDAKTEPISKFVIYDNDSQNRTQEPSKVDANPFGLKNMLGSVMEYCADKYDAEAYSKTGETVTDPIQTEGENFVVRGGNYASDAGDVRCAARDYSKHDAWLKTDPQQPKSIWWYSDIKGIGFRIVCEVPEGVQP